MRTPKHEGDPCRARRPAAVTSAPVSGAFSLGAQTRALLKASNNYGLQESQIHFIKQSNVPALQDNDGHFVQAKGDPFELQARRRRRRGAATSPALQPHPHLLLLLYNVTAAASSALVTLCIPLRALIRDLPPLQTKPHGHGDVHTLLHQSGLLPKFAAEGRKCAAAGALAPLACRPRRPTADAPVPLRRRLPPWRPPDPPRPCGGGHRGRVDAACLRLPRYVAFFQDTNVLAFKALPAALGVSERLGAAAPSEGPGLRGTAQALHASAAIGKPAAAPRVPGAPERLGCPGRRRVQDAGAPREAAPHQKLSGLLVAASLRGLLVPAARLRDELAHRASLAGRGGGRHLQAGAHQGGAAPARDQRRVQPARRAAADLGRGRRQGRRVGLLALPGQRQHARDEARAVRCLPPHPHSRLRRLLRLHHLLPPPPPLRLHHLHVSIALSPPAGCSSASQVRQRPRRDRRHDARVRQPQVRQRGADGLQEAHAARVHDAGAKTPFAPRAPPRTVVPKLLRRAPPT